MFGDNRKPPTKTGTATQRVHPRPVLMCGANKRLRTKIVMGTQREPQLQAPMFGDNRKPPTKTAMETQRVHPRPVLMCGVSRKPPIKTDTATQRVNPRPVLMCGVSKKPLIKTVTATQRVPLHRAQMFGVRPRTPITAIIATLQFGLGNDRKEFTMKKPLLSFLTILLIGCGLANGKTKYVTANLNLRSKPNTQSHVLTTIPKGTTIEIEDDCQCLWVPVYYNGHVGYVCTKYISNNPPSSTCSNNVLRAQPKSPIRYYKNSYCRRVQSPTYYTSQPAGATALCRDGSYSFSQHRQGTCSGHRGVAVWL